MTTDIYAGGRPKSATNVITRCGELKNYWSRRDDKFREWYKLIEQVDELKTEHMESFVGNDPRSLYNLVLHMLDTTIPHRVRRYDASDLKIAEAVAEVNSFYDSAWEDVEYSFRRSGPRQSFNRQVLAFLLATGWYSVFSIVANDGSRVIADVWNPAQVYPAWFDAGLSEVAHIFNLGARSARRMARRNGWNVGRVVSDVTIYDYWWMDEDDLGRPRVWNAVVFDNLLVKNEPTRFTEMPIFVSPVGGLPDTGPLSRLSGEGSGAYIVSDRWKAELGQAVIATNENVYKSWNKWWTFSLQLLRDTAQPRIFVRSQTGKHIVTPQNLFRRGGIFEGGVQDSVDYLSPPPIPLELRATQLDLEAMMQRGGVNWAMYGSAAQRITAYVMAQIAASANQVIKPFHQAFINLLSDIDNFWLDDLRQRGVKPYDFTLPPALPDTAKVTAEYDIEIPGDLVQRATVARMLDPEFRMSYTYVMSKLFPDVKDAMRERAQIRADQAEAHPSNAFIALVQYYRQQSAYLRNIGDDETAGLYDKAAMAAEALITSAIPPAQPTQGRLPGPREEALPRQNIPEAPVA
jgi:hypothetical protein|tara:strand:- start:4791 stop:6515 length:1725 start_codon:yes stop_codon:yes gene_type:complete